MTAELNDLPTFWSPEPILAWKIMKKPDMPPECMLSRMGGTYRIGETYEAICQARQDFNNTWIYCHGEIPLTEHSCDISSSDECLIFHPPCGFYGWKIDYLPDDINDMIHGFPVLVEFTGRVLEHEFGYRSSHQKIIIAGKTISFYETSVIKEFLTLDQVIERRRQSLGE